MNEEIGKHIIVTIVDQAVFTVGPFSSQEQAIKYQNLFGIVGVVDYVVSPSTFEQFYLHKTETK